MLKVWELEEDKEYIRNGYESFKYKMLRDNLFYKDIKDCYINWNATELNLKSILESEFTEIKKEEPKFEKYEKVQVRDSDGDKWVNRYYLGTDNDDLFKYKVCCFYDEFTGFIFGHGPYKQIRKLGDN